MAGYKPGSKEMDRLQRLMTANLFAIGLVSLLPYSIFEYVLPAPLNYFQNLADWMFGNKKERERAFFAGSTGIPSAIAPLNEFFPPIARLPKGLYDLPNTFGLIFGGEAGRMSEYTTYTLFPYGRLGKDALKVLNDPTSWDTALFGIPDNALLYQMRSEEPQKPWARLYGGGTR